LHATDQVKTATPQSTAPVPAGKYRLISRVQGEDTVVVGSDVVLFRAPAASTPGAPARPTVTSRLLLKSPVSGTEASKIVDHARTFRKENEAMIWFKRNDHEYIVRDDGTIKELEALVEAVHVSGTREALYSRVLSDERRVARIGAPAPDVSAQLQEIQTKLAALSAQLKSTDTTDAARRQMADLGKQLETLGRNMQQPVFYPKTPNVAWLSLARGFNETEVFAVLDRAITKGVAQQVK
jgi:hypothetical protein